jgi:hypothetical protein
MATAPPWANGWPDTTVLLIPPDSNGTSELGGAAIRSLENRATQPDVPDGAPEPAWVWGPLSPQPDPRLAGETVETVETRTISVVSLHPCPDLGDEFFPHATQAIKLIRRRRPLRGRWRTVTVYAITSLTAFQADPVLLARWIHGHWGIENRLHWVRDVSFDEDRSQVRTAHGPQVMAALRNLAITALRMAGITNIAAGLRHHARDTLRF